MPGLAIASFFCALAIGWYLALRHPLRLFGLFVVLMCAGLALAILFSSSLEAEQGVFLAAIGFLICMPGLAGALSGGLVALVLRRHRARQAAP